MSPWSSTFATTQTDEAAEAIRRGFGYQVSLSAGDLWYKQHVVVGDTVAVSDLHLGANLRLELDPTTEVMLVQLHQGTYTYNPWAKRRTIGANGAFLIPPEQSLSFEIDHADVSTCSFSIETLRSTAQAVFDLDDVTLKTGAALPLDPGKAWLWAKSVEAYRSQVLSEPTVYDDALIRAEATRFVVVNAISTFGLIAIPTHGARDSAATLRAVHFIDENLRSPITMQDIATAARLSTRGLLAAFQRERDQTPMQYLRAGRLHAAKRALESADPTRGDTVASVTARWGFSNQGRFAAAYRRTFGESPRDTLRS